LFGNGLNSINFKVIKPNTTNVILNIRNAESQIIQILFEIGLVGLLIYIIITILILNILSLNYKIILLSLISLNFFNSYQENIIFMVLFGSIVGIGANNKIK
jgi:O-antigen ligase